MNPAWSIILFTTMAGSAQGLVVALAVACLAGADLGRAFVGGLLAAATVLLVAALVASFFHLGHRMRAWRAALMWRTSWMSREVIVLPAFIGLIAIWFVIAQWGEPSALRDRLLPIAVMIGSVTLWYCTAMIYACIRFIQEWAHPLTIANYLLTGLASGLVLFSALLWLTGDPARVGPAAAWALTVTVVAALVRVASIRRNRRLVPLSTPQSAIGVPHRTLVQTSMGMSGGSFNTREFMHGKAPALIARIRWIAIGLGFVVPALLLVGVLAGGSGGWLALAVPVQAVGLLADRWFFFAQARHPQNVYYQVVS